MTVILAKTNWFKSIIFEEMKTKEVKIDFDALSQSMREFIREKAIKAGSTIVYQEGNCLIEENPATGEKKILKKYSEAVKL